MIINKIGSGAIALLLCGVWPAGSHAQDKPSMSVSLTYNTINNNIPYLVLSAKVKTDGKFRPVKGQAFDLYLDKDSSGKGANLIGKITTNEQGLAGATIPPTLEAAWKANTAHTFVATSAANKDVDASNTEISISKARLVIDTAADKNVKAVVSEYKNGAWVPVKGVELKLAVKRQGADLPISEEQSYTTDSLGQVTAEFKRLDVPGDEKGNIVLVGKIEDNDQYGNMRVEQSVNWGKKFVVDQNFFHRALWASRFHSPFWLVFMAYSIIVGVWGTVIYLIFMLVKIKKLGKHHK